MSLDKNLIESLIDITSKAAISCYPHLGKGNKNLADKAATDVMRYNPVSYTHLTLPTTVIV